MDSSSSSSNKYQANTIQNLGQDNQLPAPRPPLASTWLPPLPPNPYLNGSSTSTPPTPPLLPRSLRNNSNAERNHRGPSSSTGSIGRAGRYLRTSGDEAIPASAPPTYVSGSSNGDIREQLEQRWFRSQNEGLQPQPDQEQLDEEPSMTRPSIPHSASAPISSTPHPPLDLSSFLADLSLSRIPAPSILSSVPDELLRCCACSKVMENLRYCCMTCGPILPDADLSDDGTQMEQEEDQNQPTQDEGKGKAQEPIQDPLGVNPTHVALPLSPLSSPTSTSTPLSNHQPFHGTNNPRPVPPPLQSSSNFQSSPVPEEEERSGFELCSECVETEGVKHAVLMRCVAKVRANDPSGECVGELSHAFAEVMRISSNQGWREVDYDDDVHCTTCGTGPVQTNRFKCLSCSNFELCLTCYRIVEDVHPVHSFLAIPDRPARPRSSSLSQIGSTAEDVRLSYLRRSESTTGSLTTVKHAGIICFGCREEIVGPR